MNRRVILSLAVLSLLLGGTGWAVLQVAATGTGTEMTDAAQGYLETLTDEQKASSLLKYGDTKQRVGWHFIPKDERKGLQIKNMTPEQRVAAKALLKSCLSSVGYDKATKIMELEGLLRALEKGRSGGPIRDPERYYFTLFGEPTEDGKWGLSIEGHHLSLNFVVDKDQVVSSTPTFFAANPGIVMESVDGSKIQKGTRVLAQEEQLAFELVQSLTDEQKKTAVFSDKAPREIRAAGEAQPPTDAPIGLSFEKLESRQKDILRNLVSAYARNLPRDVASARLRKIVGAGPANVYFAWAGATEPGIGHYYRIQGPSFLIEFVNTQPDAAGNPANHIHCVWRDMAGDFDLPIKK